MKTETIKLNLSSDLVKKAKTLMGDSGNLESFLAEAIAKEIERRQMPKTHQEFWDTVSQIQSELQAEDLEIDPDEVWSDVRDASPGREIAL